MIGFNKNSLNKKINLEQTVCEIQIKINELIEAANENIKDNNEIVKEMEKINLTFTRCYDYEGVKFPIVIEEEKISIGTLYRTKDNKLKLKISDTESKEIQFV